MWLVGVQAEFSKPTAFSALLSDEASFITGCTFSSINLPAYHTPFLTHVLIMNNQPLTYRRQCIISLKALCIHIATVPTSCTFPFAHLYLTHQCKCSCYQSWWKNLCPLKRKVGERGRKVPLWVAEKAWRKSPRKIRFWYRAGLLTTGSRTQVSSQTLPELSISAVSWNFQMRESLWLTSHGKTFNLCTCLKSWHCHLLDM